MRRPRGPGGRFLTADEVAAIESGKGGELGDELADKEGIETPAKASLTSSRSSGNKRKAATALGDERLTPSNKKIKHEPARRSTSVEESDEPEEDDEGDDDT